jgi:hypothetical protein
MIARADAEKHDSKAMRTVRAKRAKIAERATLDFIITADT